MRVKSVLPSQYRDLTDLTDLTVESVESVKSPLGGEETDLTPPPPPARHSLWPAAMRSPRRRSALHLPPEQVYRARNTLKGMKL